MTDPSARVQLPVRLLFHDRLAAAIVGAAKAERRLALLCRPRGADSEPAFHGLDPRPEELEAPGAWHFALMHDEGALAQLPPSYAAELERGGLGLAVYPDHGRDPDSLCDAARGALDGIAAAARDADWATDAGQALSDAFLEQRCELHYQPQVEAASGRVVGLEALIRAYGPGGAPLTLEALNLASDGGGGTGRLIDWILEQALIDLAKLRRSAGPGLRVAVNLSLAEVVASDLPARLERHRTAAGLPADCLEVEVTEQIYGPSLSHAAARLQALRGQQVRTALDDFGTGFSTLTLLNRLPFDTLKIDRVFVAPLGGPSSGEADEAAALVAAMIALGQAKGLRVIAEGVERAEQLAVLRQLGCELYQGNYFSPPVTHGDVESLLKAA
ncbi:MAG: EAL domain-containing protein [Pseudomonadota bacterium]